MGGKAANSLHSPNKATAPAGKGAALSAQNRAVLSNKQQPNAPAASAALAKAGQKLPSPRKPEHGTTAMAKVGQSKAPVMTKAPESSSSSTSSSSESEEENKTPTTKAPAPKAGEEPAECGKCVCASALLWIWSEPCLQPAPFSSLAGKLRVVLVPWGACKNTAKQPAPELCGMNPACSLPFQAADSVP